MLKLRYFRIKVDPDDILNYEGKQTTPSDFGVSVVERAPKSLVLRYTANRLVPTFRILEDGTELKQQVQVTDQSLVRIFQTDTQQYLSIIDAPRGAKIVSNILNSVSNGKVHYWESLEISKEIIERHVDKFASRKLVAARVKDFQVTPSAIGRLEVASKEGLPNNVAPFLENKFFKIDSLTYEVVVGFQRGLITYYSNGTVRVSEPIVQEAFPTFEREL